MPFFLYHIDGGHFECVGSVSLAGLNGPFCAAARCKPDNPEWELEERLLRSLDATPENHAVIIDLKPRMTDEVSLYRLKHVWGYSAAGWTPLALELEGLYVDAKPPRGINAANFKKRFPCVKTPGDQIYEFLYVGGDGHTGTWNFGRVGGVNAPLLWSNTLDSFLKRINRKRRDKDRLPPLGHPSGCPTGVVPKWRGLR